MIKKILRKCKRVVNNIILNVKLNSKHEEIIEFDPNYLEKLNKIQPMPTGDIDANNNIEYKYDLQIIVPCYNVEEYVEDCIKSILNQKTKYNYILTIINDGSTDNTLSILKKFEKDERVELIDQENKGISGARNTGLKNMKAKYITFVDSDDMLTDNSIESLLDTAFSHEDADIIEANHFILNNGMTLQNNRYKENAYANPTTLDGYPWGKLYKAELWKDFQFPEGFWFEDTILAYILFYKAKKAYVSNIYIYIYRIRQGSITHVAKQITKSLDTFYITDLLLRKHKELKLPVNDDYIKQMRFQCWINMGRTFNCSDEVKRLCLSYMNDQLRKYFDVSKLKNDKLFESILKMDYYKTYLFAVDIIA